MPITLRHLPAEEIRTLTPDHLSLAPIFNDLDTLASPAGTLLLAESGPTPVGLAALLLTDTTLHIRHFAISPRHHGQGIGSKLLAAIKDHARSLHATKITATFPGWCPDWRAFYTRAGFTLPNDSSDTALAELPL